MGFAALSSCAALSLGGQILNAFVRVSLFFSRGFESAMNQYVGKVAEWQQRTKCVCVDLG